MTTLGLNCGHDASCAIVCDGVLVFDVQEERYTRQKHCSDFPVNALRACLDAAGIDDINKVDRIAIGSCALTPQLVSYFGLEDSANVARKPGNGRRSKLSGSGRVSPPIYLGPMKIEDPRKIQLVEHHLAHAASAYFTRDNAGPCLIFTSDGIGDDISTAIWRGEGTEIVPLKKFGRESSIGWAYSVVTEGLGWWHGDGEGKTMGLAPYGDARKCQGRLDHLFPKFRGTDLATEIDLGPVSRWVASGACHWHFAEAADIKELADSVGRENVAAEAQRKLEECVQDLVFGWLEHSGLTSAAFAGGVFLNVKLNQRIWHARRTLLKEQHIFPNAGDAGVAVGAALYAYHRREPFSGAKLRSLALGPRYEDADIVEIVRSRGLPFEIVDNPPEHAARLLNNGLIVGWFQGRMESGPRSLGNRAILMDPRKAENKDVINARVKFREGFRPFCPSIAHERREDYLLDCRDEFFMITSFDVNPLNADKLKAVTHVDGTVRPQMVRRDEDELYWRLIDAFGRMTGVYAVLNTSMNIRGEPIVNTPGEAIRMFYDSGLDVLFLGSVLLRKGTCNN